MSFVIAAVVGTATAGIIGGALVAGAAVSYYQGDRALAEQKKANKQAMENAKKAEKQADEAFNAANQKTPDILSLMRANQLAAGGGVSGTMLTGASGSDPSKALLGKVTPLGR